MAEKKEQGVSGAQTQSGPQATPQSPQPQGQGKAPKAGSTKMKVHLESTGPIFTINGGYGPMYDMELEKDVVLMLLREGVYVTDAATRKRIILVNGEPGVEA